ncbi:Uncharacterized protein OS=Singulisphaera acidiphila (strain ATCC BAA-1392 / DSM 18658 / VKM B-2454 / MOB10) GN=Sinac_3715 PE=4 SV=1 [Tuwongella immobilis]|uniref:YkgJ family cysteine cluster protein n=1 Tax=Tuwongella immobilis TaxID=692036 RepID=A0A6C2YV78_9BACT|nr:Uncharacterized protein OS=Singulisphaera acidiphila (strain ATCC BAA-1392 / DSM 18658 / VKM B-2454 / MOB10) GN=Sinac_3715 PE=4 SV=1 [Tuwongella immobilis]VTS07137.1 Uncharacterized protein OS=Singulisphaera acidiphila (strain ATCC BAA-1392 / DSM 18658 / VKM B-2454 / MOB10) GN=Sinac_3715 PE=4 SV=1 [Tuwongella immobilis]
MADPTSPADAAAPITPPGSRVFPGKPALPDAVRQAIWELYAEIDATIAAISPRCDASGKCCRFEEVGHVLFLSSFEAEILLEQAPPYSQPVDSGNCPFQKRKLCTAREPRPLGCRIYYCDPTYQETSNDLTEMAIQRLKSLAQAHGLDWEYAPLHYFLNQAERAGIPLAEADHPSPSGRTSLPLLPD